MYSNRDLIIWLNYIGVSNTMIGRLVEGTDDLNDLFDLGREELTSKYKISDSATSKILNEKMYINEELEKISAYNILTIYDEEYPQDLREIYDPPSVLYYKGCLDSLKFHKRMGVVGSRKVTSYGIWACEYFTGKLLENDVVIVSGLASGIDTISHRMAIEHGGITIGVLGCGIDVVYPSKNRELYREIEENKGLILTEYPPKMEPLSYNFPKRNRIISGLSKGVIVVEAKKKSGSLITAHEAINQGKEVFAIPGNINSVFSQGTNQLIRDGAIPLLCWEDIIDNMPYLERESGEIVLDSNLSELENIIVNLLREMPCSSNEVSCKLNMDIGTVNGILTVLELKGILIERGNKYYLLC